MLRSFVVCTLHKIRVLLLIKSRMREKGDETYSGDKREAHRFLVGKLKERSRLDDLGLHWRIPLK